MNNGKSKWIRKLFKEMDIGLILSLGDVYGKDFAEKINPKRLYRRAKGMYKQGHPAVKTWGKKLNMKFEETKTEGVKNG